jgi:hypothetical protein
MKSKLIAFGLAIAALPAFAQEGTTNYGKSVFSQFHSIPANTRKDASSLIQKVQQHFPGMDVTIDKLSGNFTDIFGIAMPIPGATNQDKAAYCFSNYLSDFGVNGGEWEIVGESASPKASFIRYTQKINGHPVVFSKLNFKFANDGKLIRLQMKNYGTPSTGLTPAMSAEDARIAAVNDVSGVAISESSVEQDWYWFPVPAQNGYDLRPAYAFDIKGQGKDIPVELKGYVDAVSGAVLYRFNTVKETVTQTVKGSVYKQNPTLPATLEPLANLKVTIGGSDYYTDTAGLLNDATLVTPITATMKLEGRWSTVNAIASGGVTPNFQNIISTNGLVYTFPTTAPSDDRHVNAYYHVNRVHEFMKSFYPTFTYMDFPLPTNVDVSGSCNAFYNGSSINFYEAGGGCNSFANCGDIIYHEYGHGISDNFYSWQGAGTIFNGALNEGNSDIWGISITHDPVLGKGSTPFGGIIRRYDLLPKVYPQNIIGEVHNDGEIIAGAWWDVAVNINSVDTMSMLFTDTYYDTPDGPDGTEGDVYHQVLISALQSDDNDNNLSNGTPHFSQIINAFARHGIYLLSDAALTHTEIANPSANTAITINASLTLSTPAFFQSLMLQYRQRGGQWDTVAMTNTSGNNYTAQIPAQTEGTIMDYYFAVYDNTGALNATFPVNYKPSVSLALVTIPYQFGVGLDAKTAIDFESSLSGWTIGNAPGDNAFAGIWIQAKPVGSYISSAQGMIPVQPNIDHTLGATGKCLVTGNAVNTSSSLGMADVDNGKTSVITPVFDLTGFTEPIIEYWRWYSNNAGSNPGEDYWAVYIKDSAATPWILSVDYTRQTDNQWRRRIFKTKDFLPSSEKIALKFQAQDLGQGSVVEAAVDDIVIYDKAVINGVNDVNALKASIYPNPANEAIQIRLSKAATGVVLISDMTGRQVLRSDFVNSSFHSINTSNIAPGSYLVTVRTGKLLQLHKIVIAH